MRYHLLFRWFAAGLARDDEAWNHSVFSKSWDRLLEYEIVEAFFTEVMTVAGRAHLLSREHFKLTMTASNRGRLARMLGAVPQGATQ